MKKRLLAMLLILSMFSNSMIVNANESPTYDNSQETFEINEDNEVQTTETINVFTVEELLEISNNISSGKNITI